jgi:hypothetical protein
MQPDEARAALDDVQTANFRLAEKAGHCPPWRHAAFGGIYALLIGSFAVSSTVLFVAMPVVLLCVFLLLRADRKRYGMFVNGYRWGATLPLTLSFAGLMVGLAFAAIHMRTQEFTDVSKVALSAVVFVLAIVFSVKWHSVFHRELTEV